MDANAADYFGRLPKLCPMMLILCRCHPRRVTRRPAYVRAIPRRAPRQSIGFNNLMPLKQRPLYELPPQRRMRLFPASPVRIALSQKMSDQPKFRQDYYAKTAFGRGLGAFYFEHPRGAKAGMYETPIMNAWRAFRWRCGGPAASSRIRACTGMAGRGKRPRPCFKGQ